MKPYCRSRLVSIRRDTREVKVGQIGVGGLNPIRIQSMTTTLTTDIEGTVKQTRALAEAGCEIVRITAPNVKAAKALAQISRCLRKDRVDVPLVADIHFLPSAAMEAVKHVEKVRVNPGNYADKKKFKILEYSDKEYEWELERLHEAFSPLVLRCKELGRSMRIGTNHGSLSDRIMNRFGDSPMGMVESALEFIRIAESHNYHDIILSMKASNPKVMIQAYRLAVAKMDQENMDYPLHLGVTEAGDGEDGRIKSTIGIGSLLADGLGDTIRVSLTEDPIYEIPVAQAIAQKTNILWSKQSPKKTIIEEDLDPYSYRRREIIDIRLNAETTISSKSPPRVFLKPGGKTTPSSSIEQLISLKENYFNSDTPIEGWIISIINNCELNDTIEPLKKLQGSNIQIVVELGKELTDNPQNIQNLLEAYRSVTFSVEWENLNAATLGLWTAFCASKDLTLAIGIAAEDLGKNAAAILSVDLTRTILYPSTTENGIHAIGQHRLLASIAESMGIKLPIWIRSNQHTYLETCPGFLNDLLETSLLAGSLLSDGLGDILSVENVETPEKALSLAYNVLQGASARISKTEYVACPSCGRTLFDLQSTTQKIREATNHLKGVKVAVMGCIVNGPGEMADADFGYVGGAPGRVNLYVGKDCIEYHVPEKEAVTKLIELIRGEGKWVDPSPHKTSLLAEK
jgi:(E)-4-hydroxy-3-methylbut-2-enyl-diphosphate synthase